MEKLSWLPAHFLRTPKGKLFALTYNYTGYPMVKEAREIVRRGELGKMLKVVTEYPQGWLLNPLDAKGQEQVWRNDPNKAGATGCLGDIGTHVEHLARYVTGLEIDELSVRRLHQVWRRTTP
jgi:predicted dehydrogenase